MLQWFYLEDPVASVLWYVCICLTYGANFPLYWSIGELENRLAVSIIVSILLLLFQSTRLHPRSLYREEFSVPRELMGLAIGTQGCNIQQAKQVQGVHSISLDEATGTFTVQGEVSLWERFHLKSSA